MANTQIWDGNTLGFKNGVRERSNDPTLLTAWRKQYMHCEKTSIMEELAVSCGYGVLLVQFWLRNRLNPAAVEFYDVCKLCYEHELTGHLLSGTILADWHANDWRGIKGQKPTPMQLFERGLSVKADLLRQAEKQMYANQHRTKFSVRKIDLESLPSVYDRIKSRQQPENNSANLSQP